jgi:hypothetical protein
LSGNIFGKRTKVPLLELSSFRLREVGTSVPDSLHIDDSRILSARDGSLGGAVLKRFRILLDYQNSRMVIKPNSHLRDPFYYNMSGLVLEHDGLIPVREVAYFNINPVKMASERKEASGIFDVYKAPTLEYFLAPRFVVVSVRPESPADLVEIKQGDEVVSINGKPSYKYKLYEMNALFSSQAGKTISFRIKRNGILLKKKITLKKVL